MKKLEENQQDKSRFTTCMAYLRRNATEWQPEKDVPESPTDGIVMMVIEIAHPDEIARKSQPIPVGDVFCNLILLNLSHGTN